MDMTMEMERDKKEEQEQRTGSEGMSNGRTLHSEVDLSDRDEFREDSPDEHHDAEIHVDYSHYSKQQLSELIKELSKETDFRKVDVVIREIKPLYDELREKERGDALQRFISNGGTAEDFDFKG